MSDLVNFTCLRIQAELDKFQRSKTIPHDLIDGVWTIDDIADCVPSFAPKYKRLSKLLISEYSEFLSTNIHELKSALRKEYAVFLSQAKTRDFKFSFPIIMNKYRPSINPIRALFYETRNMIRRFNSLNEEHIFLIGILHDLDFNNALLDALSHDIQKLEKLIKRYYWPLLKFDDQNIPLELFHARQQLKDGKHYYNFFLNMQNWQPDE